MTRDMVQVRTPAGRVPPHLAVLLFIGLFASVVGVGLYGDDLAGLGRRPAPTPLPSRVAVASPAATPGASAVPPPTTPATPTAVCEPPVVEPLDGPMERHPAPLVPTTLESMVPPSEADGQILVDGRGVMWSHGPGRLARLDHTEHVAKGWTVADDVRFGASIVAPARGGGVWLVSDGTHDVAWFDGRALRDLVPLPGDTSALAEAADGTLWAAVNSDGAITVRHELAHWDGARWTPVCTDVPNDWIDGVAVDGRGDVWILAYAQTGRTEARRFDGRTWTNYSPGTEASLPNLAPQAMTVAPDGAVWLAYETALTRFDGTSWTRYDAPRSVDLSGTTALVVDHAGVAWLGTGTRTQAPYTAIGVHVLRFDGRTWRQFDASDGLPAPLRDSWIVVRSLAIEPRGIVAITTRGLYALNGERWGRIDRQTAPVDAANLVVMSADDAWVATTTDGLWHYRKGRWVRDNPPGYRGWPRALARGPGDTIAIATDRQIAIRRSGAWSVVLDAEGSLGPVGLAFAPDGVLWASLGDASDLVTFKWNSQGWTRRPFQAAPAIVVPMTIGFDDTGAPWLIGDGYVPRSVRFVDGRWQDVTVGDGWEPSGGMAVDREGTIWLTLRRSTIDVAIGAFDGMHWSVFEPYAPIGYLASSGLVAAPDGTILTGGSEGLLRFAGGGWEPVVPTDYVDVVAVGRDGSTWVSGSPGIVRLHAEAP